MYVIVDQLLWLLINMWLLYVNAYFFSHGL